MANRIVTCKSPSQQRDIYSESLTTTLTKTALASKHNISTRTLGRIIHNQATLVDNKQDVSVKQAEDATQVQIQQLTATVLALNDKLEALSSEFNQYKQTVETNYRNTNSSITNTVNSALQKMRIRICKEIHRGAYNYESTNIKVSLIYAGKVISYDKCIA